MTNLEGDVCLRADFGRGQLHVGVLAHEVDGDELLAALAREAGEAAAHGLVLHHDALGAVLALVVVARARLQQHHRRGGLAEQPAAETKGRQSSLGYPRVFIFISGAAILLWSSDSEVQPRCAWCPVRKQHSWVLAGIPVLAVNKPVQALKAACTALCTGSSALQGTAAWLKQLPPILCPAEVPSEICGPFKPKPEISPP